MKFSTAAAMEAAADLTSLVLVKDGGFEHFAPIYGLAVRQLAARLGKNISDHITLSHYADEDDCVLRSCPAPLTCEECFS